MALFPLKIVIIICISIETTSSWSIFGTRKKCSFEERMTLRGCFVKHGHAIRQMGIVPDEVLMTRMNEMNATCHSVLRCFDGLSHCDLQNILPVTREVCSNLNFLAGDFVPCYQELKTEKTDKCVVGFMDVFLGRNKDRGNACRVYKNECIDISVKKMCGEDLMGRFRKAS